VGDFDSGVIMFYLGSQRTFVCGKKNYELWLILEGAAGRCKGEVVIAIGF
jgi:hypothetical protein